MPTARELIIGAYQGVGLRAIGQPVTDDDAVFGLSALNYDVLDVLKNDLNFPPSIDTATFSFVQGQSAYTMATTGSPDILLAAVPTDVLSIHRLEGGIYTGLEQVSTGDFFRENQYKTEQVLPGQFTFVRNQAGFEIRLSAPSSVTAEGRIAVRGVINAWTLDSQIDLPAGYFSLIKYKLMSLLAQGNGLFEDAQLAEARAANLMQTITNTNSRMPPKLSGSYSSGRYDILTDTVV